MTIKDMHYDFKKKINKVDSEKYKNLLVPEIDWVLNEAYELYVKIILQPKAHNSLNFQISQGTLDDLYPIIKNERSVENKYPVINEVSFLPSDYWYYISSFVTMSKNSCLNIEGKVFKRQQEDEFERSPFDSSSFEWRVVNAISFNRGIRFYPKDFVVNDFNISYYRRLKYMHNAEDFRDSTYELPSGEVLGVSSGGGIIEILSNVAVTGSIDINIQDGVDIVDLSLNFTEGNSKTIIVDTIVDAINNEGTFSAYRKRSKDFVIEVVGANAVTVLTITDTDSTGIISSTTLGVTGEGSYDCELPPHTHREIVDLAALIIAGELNLESLNFKIEKMKLNFNK